MSKPKLHCNVAQYLAAEHGDFYQALTNTCAIGAVRGAVTILVPGDEIVKSLLKHSLSDDKDAFAKARDQLRALIIEGARKTAGSFRNEEIINRLGQVVELANIGDDSVTLKPKVKITLDKKFNDASRAGAAVWIADGLLPIDGKPAERKAPRRDKTGGYAQENYADAGQRFAIGVSVENKATTQILAKEYPSAFCEHVYGLAKYVLEKDKPLFYSVVLPNITHTAADFYILVEPHNKTREFLIRDELVSGWWASSAHTAGRNVVDDALRVANKPAAIYSNRAELTAAIAGVRSRLTPLIESSQQASELVATEYKKLSTDNAVGSVTGVFPEELHAIYSRQPMRKLTEDDLRYWTHCGLECILARTKSRAATAGDIADLDYLFNAIGETMLTVDNPRVCTKMLRHMIAPVERIEEIRIFVNSSLFMAIPHLPEELDKLSNNDTIVKAPADEELFYNIHKRELVRHPRVAPGGVSVDEFAARLKSIGVELTPAQMALLK